jgi:hypothetical protein
VIPEHNAVIAITALATALAESARACSVNKRHNQQCPEKMLRCEWDSPSISNRASHADRMANAQPPI